MSGRRIEADEQAAAAHIPRAAEEDLPAATFAPRDTTPQASETRLPARPADAPAAVPFGFRPPSPFAGLNDASARRRRLPLRLLSFVLIVALPVILAGVYYLSIAANQYVVQFRFALRSAEPSGGGFAGLLSGALPPSPTRSDSYAVVQYIRSRTIIDDLGKSLDLRALFTRPEADFLARLDPRVPIEGLVRYWRGQVDAFYDTSDGTITVTARAFRRRDALDLAQAILAASERLVNTLSARARRDALRQAQRDVKTAETRLKTALAQLRAFRDKEGVIDPHRSAAASSALAGQVRDELVHADADLATLKNYLHGDAPTLKLLEARIRSLRRQRRAVESEVTTNATTQTPALSRIMDSYEPLEAERRFAENAYQHALQALDRARLNAERQQVYLAVFVRPSLPQEALYPHRLRSLGLVFLIAFAVWGIGSLAVQSVRDHL